MTTMQSDDGRSMRRTLSLPLILSALAAVGILVLAAAWPTTGDAPSLLSRAAADPSVAAVVSSSARMAWSQSTGVPDAATVFVAPAAEPEETAPTF